MKENLFWLEGPTKQCTNTMRTVTVLSHQDEWERACYVVAVPLVMKADWLPGRLWAELRTERRVERTNPPMTTAVDSSKPIERRRPQRAGLCTYTMLEGRVNSTGGRSETAGGVTPVKLNWTWITRYCVVDTNLNHLTLNFQQNTSCCHDTCIGFLSKLAPRNHLSLISKKHQIEHICRQEAVIFR